MSRIITKTHRSYPKVLAELADAPLRLFFRGNRKLLEERPALAVIGSRKMTAYGRKAVELLLPEIVRAGVPIISGLALGTDSYAHDIALAHHGKIIVVLPSGLDTIYPRSHTVLAERILNAGGLLITEYPEGSGAPRKYCFLMRNRIIAALADVILIVEAAARSGALATARRGLELGREVAAVPGNITAPFSQGTNGLIRRGAFPILEPQDLAMLLGVDLTRPPVRPAQKLTKEEEQVLKLFQGKEQSVDQLLAMSTMETSVFLSTLSALEVKGVVENLGDMHFLPRTHLPLND